MFLNCLNIGYGQFTAPHIRNYTIKSYGELKSPEVWSVCQDEKGLLYFGFVNEIGIFDGVKWSYVSVPSAKNITSLHFAEGKVYFGGYGKFGVLEPNADGLPEAVFISDKATKVFSNIWRIHNIDDLIYFQGTEAIFTYKQDELNTIIPKTSYHISFKYNNHILVREREIGLMKVSANSTVLINDNPLIQEYGVFGAYKIGDDKSLLITSELGFRHSNIEITAPLLDPCENGCQFAINVGIIGSVKVRDNLFALFSKTQGVYFIDNNGGLLGHIDSKSGLTTDEVKDVLVDNNGKLWLATGNGISKVEILEPFEFINENFGINGNVQCFQEFKGYKYVGTALGLMKEQDSLSLRFGKTQIQNQVWSLLNVKSKLFVATGNGLYISEDGQVFEKLLDGDFNALKYDDLQGFLIVAGEGGVIILDELNNWLPWSSKVFTGGNKNKISYDKKNDCYWVGSSSGGILQIKFDGFDFIYKLYGVKEGEGLRIGEQIIPFEINGTCLFGTPYDLLEFTNEEEAIEELKLSGNWHDTLINYPEFYPGTFFESQVYSLGSSINYQYYLEIGDVVLAVIDNEIGYFRGNDVFDKNKFQAVELGRVNFLQIEEDGLYIGGSEGLSRANLLSLLNDDSTNNIIDLNIRKVVYNDSISIGFYNLNNPLSIPYYKNKISIEFASNVIHNDKPTVYSWRLIGDEDNWSSWSSRVKIDFKNLHEGDYIFEVKAKDIFGVESDVKRFSFVIEKPWFRTVWAYVGYFILFVLIVYLAIVIGSRRLKAQNLKLEETVRERTAEIREKNSELEHSYHEIAEQKQEITDSINYAQRIQHAILPLPENIEQHLEEYFVIFQPKDIVSGDFYWFAQTEEGVVFVCADCTGHGVPGAFMSMIGSDKLNQAVLEAKLTNPAEILSFLNRGIKKSLKQKEDEEGASRDGMDVTVTHIDTTRMKLKMAAAHNSLLMIRDGEMIEYKATKVAVGGFTAENQVYNLEEIDIKKGDVFYMTTDGYPDQFGGEKGKKLKIAVLKRILMEIHHLPMSEQKEYLENYMKEWMGEHEQIDDICFIGIRI